ncbi:MAG TPA: hypothetical protein DIT67_09050 [Octadecabacter sp.]|nr:hypothetical protein [Octadecabacter sp.]
MDSVTLRDALAANSQDLKDIIRYGRLGIPKGKQGSPRDWSRDDAILSGYYLAACKAGVPANEAADLARFWTNTEEGQEYDIWIFNIEEPFFQIGNIFPFGHVDGADISVQNALDSVETHKAEWSETIGKPVPPLGIVVINLSGIRSRIDAAAMQSEQG